MTKTKLRDDAGNDRAWIESSYERIESAYADQVLLIDLESIMRGAPAVVPQHANLVVHDISAREFKHKFIRLMHMWYVMYKDYCDLLRKPGFVQTLKYISE